MNRTSASQFLMKPQSYFANLQKPVTPRSQFDRSNEILTTFDSDYLIPGYVDEVLPSDTWKVSQSVFARILTLVKPLMDNLYLDVHWFFVPNRIVWTHWANFMGEQVDPASPVTYTIPQVTVTNGVGGGTKILNGEIGDYFGLPTDIDNLTLNALFFRAYMKIYDDWYRDENFVAVQLPVASQGDTTVVYNATRFPLYKRGKRKDYFTSALPWAQKGTAPTITLGGSAPLSASSATVKPSASTLLTGAQADAFKLSNAADGTAVGADAVLLNRGSDRLFTWSSTAAPGTVHAQGLYVNNIYADLTGITANLASATGFTLNTFREFATIQQYLERDARGGTRYVESLYTRFGVFPEDARLQRAEYLGGQTFTLNVSPIAQTAATGATGTPQANLAGMGTFTGTGHQFVKSFTEHGTIMAIFSVRQEQRYQYGIHKMWSRTTQYDFFDPIFANLGEQPILNQELYAQGTGADDDVFGYQEAWAEYRYKPSLITGRMRSNYTTSLDVWHLAQEYGSLPTLGKTFIEEDVPMDRVVAVTSEPAFMLNARFNCLVARPMPVRSIPGLTRL